MLQLRGSIASVIVLLAIGSLVACSGSTAAPPTESSSAPTGTMSISETVQSHNPTEAAASKAPTTDSAAPTETEAEASPSPLAGPSDAGSYRGTVSPVVDPSGPDITLYTLPECSVVPGGAVSGADALSMLVAVRNSGPGSWNSPVPYRVTSDTGLSSSGTTALNTGSQFTAISVDLRRADYRRKHRFTITADPDNQVRERDETNNNLVITVVLPPRPTGTVNVKCTSP